MRIADLLGRQRPVFSFEFSPPKTAAGEEALYRTIEHLRELRPDFVSVTYGAGGSTREKTMSLVGRIKHELGIESMAHLTCVGAGRDEIASILSQLRDSGIENVLALRGDPPRDQPTFVRPANGFGYASELVHFIRESGFDFSLGGAGYPEGHLECRDLDADMRHLREKVDAGIEFIITQLFFDNRDYFAFERRARQAGITIPIIPGIMPITNAAQIQRIATMCGSRIPDALAARLNEVDGDEQAVRAVGIEHAAGQCRDLLDHDAPGIHFYTLNQSPATRVILESLRG